MIGIRAGAAAALLLLAPVPAIGSGAIFRVAAKPVVDSGRVLPVAAGVPLALGLVLLARPSAGRRAVERQA